MTLRIATLAMGNIRSVLRALERSVQGPKEIRATIDPEVVRNADVLVVPGQGSFGAFATAMTAGGLDEAIRAAIRGGKPYLGICLGLQVLFEDSEESPGARGLSILEGHVKRLEPGEGAALPHMGWNQSLPIAPPTTTTRTAPLLTTDHYYFAHSFAAPVIAETAATTTYGGATFTSVIRKDNMLGVQFHPEKSQRAGLGLLERFFSTLKSPPC